MKNKIGTALLSLLIAFGIWLYVVSVVAPESEQVYYNVPVKIHGENVLKGRDLMLVMDEQLQLDLKLSGTRTDLAQLSSSNITVIADLSGITTAGVHTVHYSISYPGAISSAITVISPESQTITVRVVEYAEAEIPISVDYTGELPESYTADTKNTVLDHETVKIAGARDVVEKIKTACVTVDLTDRTENIDEVFDLAFLDAAGQPVELSGVTVDVQQVTVLTKINMVKNVDIVFDWILDEGLTAEDFSWSAPSQLKVYGPASLLKDYDQVVLTVDLTTVTENQIVTITMEEFGLPSGLSTDAEYVVVDVIVPPVVQQTVEFASGDIKSENLIFINKPEGASVAVISGIKFLVQGREHKIALLQQHPENIRVTIDLSALVEGTNEYTAQVQIIGIDGLEVLATYSVKVKLPGTGT